MSAGLEPPSPSKYLLREMSPAADEFYRRLAGGRLSTTCCESCGGTSFPPRERCPSCGVAEAWVELPMEGRLHAFTTQETALRFAAPAVLALAELGDAVVPGIMSVPYAELRVGQQVTARPFPEPESGLTLLEFLPSA
jgi:uncharacterized OB-fold protein